MRLHQVLLNYLSKTFRMQFLELRRSIFAKRHTCKECEKKKKKTILGMKCEKEHPNTCKF